MAAIDDYVVTPSGVVDVGGNPVTYDSSGNINPTYTTDLAPDISGITSLLTPFKGIFERLKSGNTTANDVNAALGVLGLLMPSLNRPQTAGWKGSIDLSKQYTRTPMAQPEYKPYAQSAAPVMGRQFFNTTYGAPPPAPAAPPPPAAPNPDLTNPSSTGGMARGGIAGLRRFDEGGNVEQPQRSSPQFYDYNVGANARMVNVPGIEKPVLMFFDTPNNRVVVSDEGYWNPNSPVGEDLNKAVAWARDQGLQAGVVVSPYSWEGFGKDTIGEDLDSGSAHQRSMPGASFDQLKDYMNAADFVVTDPYVVSAQTATPGVQEKLMQITNMIGDHAQKTNKPAWLVLGGSTAPEGTDPNTIYNYTDQLLSNVGNKFNQVSVFEGSRDLQPGAYAPTWDYLSAANILAKNGIQPTGAYGQAYESQQSVAPTPYVGYDVGSKPFTSLQEFQPQQTSQPAQVPPTGIAAVNQNVVQPSAGYQYATREGGIGENQYLQNIRDFVRQNVTDPQSIKSAADQYGVSFGDIQSAFKPTSNMNFSGYENVLGQVGNLFNPPAVDQQEEQKKAIPTQVAANPDIAAAGAAQGGLMGLARGGRAMPPRYLQGETDGMADRIPSNIDGVQPAKLSHGEFVIPADVVSHLGNGNSDAGAKVLYKMMDRVRQARTGTKKQGRQINPEKFTPGGIAGYAGGGAVAFAAGDLVDTPKAPLGASTETNISSWAGPYVGDMLSKTSALTNTPYQAYQGPLVAGTSPLQSKVFGGLESLNFPGQLGQSFTAEGAYQLPTMTPGGVTGQATGPTGIAAQYMNPYLSAVLTPQLDELRRQSQITQMGTAGKLAQAGAYGGSRQAIMDAETQRNLLQEQNKAIGTGYANAYDRAMGQFNTEQQQAKTLADMMAGAGQQQRGIEQEGITALQKQYETELLDPYTKLRFQKEMLSGLPVATTSTTANTSALGEFKGGLSDLADALKKLGLG